MIVQGKRGLSTVVTTLIIVLLVLVAIGIIWFVIRNLLTETSEEIELGFTTSNLKIESAKIIDGLDAEVRIKKGVGNDKIDKIKIVLTNEKNSQVFTTTTGLKELESDVFEFDLEIASPTEIEVYPIYIQEGEEKIGKLADKEKLKTQNTDLIAHYSFDKEFETTDVIEKNINNLPTGSEARSIFLWIKTSKNDLHIMSYGLGPNNLTGFFIGRDNGLGKLSVAFGANDLILSDGPSLNNNEWHFIGFTLGENSKAITAYIDNGRYPQKLSEVPSTKETTKLQIGGTYGNWPAYEGFIDEIKIYNKVLDPSEVDKLYAQGH